MTRYSFAILLILTLELRYSLKEDATELEGVDCEIGDSGNCCTVVLVVEENFMQSWSALILFILVTRKNSF